MAIFDLFCQFRVPISTTKNSAQNQPNACLYGVQQQLGVDLVLPPEHDPLELLPRRVAELDGHALRHLPLRREHRAQALLEVDQVALQPVVPRVDLVAEMGKII